MIPGVNQRQMKQAMKKLGMQQENIDAVAVIIRTRTEDIIIRDPDIQKVNMMGEISYQISGKEEHRPLEIEVVISEEDIKTVMEQAKVNKETASVALKENNGELAAAILSLQK